jgi:L-asparaginase II
MPSASASDAANPVLVEVMRGDLVESRHRGAAAMVDAGGTAGRIVGAMWPAASLLG